ncbi:hypothetical protein EMPS_00379 [Entomortierella parvispora]|uniref:Uncharacterized protein n=1 Tax=Entomortierella parvispora TaxID=205924 RepID=A0A9P3LRK6_9FUNG|nr:hypothetical protein EMPS_00379 [Entomortierella parvispora]
MINTSQRLPNECFLVVVEYLAYDLRTLHSLLTVNRFFFHAALPWMLNRPFETWEMDGGRSTFPTSREKLIVLLLSSALRHHHRQISETKETAAGDNHDSKYANPSENVRSPIEKLLREFGLQLHSEDLLSSHPLLLECLQESRNPSASNVPRMTAEYYTFVNDFINQRQSLIKIKFEQFIRLRRVPFTMEDRFGDLGMDDMVLDIEDDDEDREEDFVHDLELQKREDYHAEVLANLQRLLFHCNAENITQVHWDMSKDSDFLRPLAKRMGSLKDLTVQWGSIVSDESIQAVVQFIQDHRAIFPNRSFHLFMNTNWIHQILNYTLAGMAPSFIRAKMEQYIRPKMLLYAAQGQVTEMDGTFVMDFYDQVLQDNKSFQLHRLEAFADDDEYRQQFAVAMSVPDHSPRQEFLKACSNLQRLRETISHRDMYAWAALAKRERRALETAAAATKMTTKDSYLYLRHALPSAILPKLTDLTLISKTRYYDTIAAMNDALEAFSDTLRAFQVDAPAQPEQDTENEDWIQSQANPRCTGMLILNPLPHLTYLCINCFSGLGLDEIGPLTFQQCPVLETLCVRMGINEHDGMPRLDAIAGDSDRLPWSLFPRWDLPRLKSLSMIGTAALRFDYDSLETMTRLELLSLECPYGHALENYLDRAPRLSTHLGIGDSMPRWTSRQWNLARLQSLEMSGLPALVFEFEWLEKMANLERIHLGIRENEYAIRGMPASQAESFNVLSGLGDRHLEVAKRSSMLEEAFFAGPWIKTVDDMRTLAHYIQGPKLSTLCLQRIPVSSDDGDDDVDDGDDENQRSSDGEDGVPVEDATATVTSESSTKNLDFELMQELVSQVRSGCPGLRRVTLPDFHLTLQEVKDLKLQTPPTSPADQCLFTIANEVYLVHVPHPES